MFSYGSVPQRVGKTLPAKGIVGKEVAKSTPKRYVAGGKTKQGK